MVKVEADCVSSSTINNTQKTAVELIKFDENSEIHYQGYCKLSVKIYAKCLSVVPVLEDFKVITGFTAPFKWKFIRQKNIIFVFGEFEYQNFALIFNDLKKCRKVYNGIFKNRNKDFVHRKFLFKQFLNPILKKIGQNGSAGRLKEIMEEWIQKHEGNEKEFYLKLLNTENEHDEIDYKPKISRKRRFCEIQNNIIADSERNILTDVTINGDNESASIEAPFKNEKIFESGLKTSIIDDSLFKIVIFQSHYNTRRKLLFFTSPEKTHCYEYIFYRTKNIFHHSCYNKAHLFKAILKLDKNGNECIELEDKKHVCSPIKYDPKRYIELKIVKKPNYEIMENCSTRSKRMLIIFDSNDRSQCYEYYWVSYKNSFRCCGCTQKKKENLAEIIHENTESEYIRLLSNQHACEIRKYNPEKFNQIKKFVLAPNFEIQIKNKNNGKETKALIIFDESNRKLCYTYYYESFHKKFLCNGCFRKGKNVNAKICQNGDGEEYVILSNVEHVCSLRTYVQQNEIILRPQKIKFMESKDEKYKPKLFLFKSNNNQFCYIFSQSPGENSNRYYCLGCKNIIKASLSKNECGRKSVTVYLYKDDDSQNTDEYYVKMMDGQTHICKPQKYDPEKYETVILKPKEDYIIFQKKGKKKDSLCLAVYDRSKKGFCFQYYYCNARKQFECLSCQYKKTCITAKVKQDSDRNEYIFMNQKKHVCSPIKFSSIKNPNTVILEKSGLTFEEPKMKEEIDENKIVRLPNFELQKNTKGNPDRKLLLFKKEDNKFCYEYGFHKDLFTCKKCKNKAKLHIDSEKNNEKYIILCENEHTCEPVKYVAEKIKIIKSSQFMIFNRDDDSKTTKLIIFTSEIKELCYEYSFNKQNKTFRCIGCSAVTKIVSAKLLTNDNGEEYIQLLKNDHICTPKKFILEEFQPKIIPESGFKLFSNKNRKPNSKLILFDSKKDGFCYEYFLTYKTLFQCNQCINKDKNVTAKLCEKENGKNYLELSAEKHICKSIEYVPEIYEETKKIFSGFVIQHNTIGGPNSRLTIFDENDKTLGYQYYFSKSVNAFYCNECRKKHHSTVVKLKTDDENGKQFVEYGKTKHHCSIQNFKEKNLIFENFKFEENGNILITTDSKKKCYKFKNNEEMGAFCCIKCKEEKKKIITATVFKGNDEKEFVVLNDKHSCVYFSK